MKYRSIGLILVLMTILTGCGKKEDVSSVPDDDIISTVVNEAEYVKTEEPVPADTSSAVLENAAEEANRTFDSSVLKSILPEGYIANSRFVNSSFMKTMKDETVVYLNYLSYTAAYIETDVQNMTLDETISFFVPLTESYVSPYYTVNSLSYNLTEESKEEIEILDSPAYKVIGKIDGNYGDEVLAYVAYYAMIPLNVYDGAVIPFCWFAFGEDSEENCAEMESAVQFFVEQSEQY